MIQTQTPMNLIPLGSMTWKVIGFPLLVIIFFLAGTLHSNAQIGSGTGPVVLVDHFHDPQANKDMTNFGAGWTWYNCITDHFHGYANLEIFAGGSDGKLSGIYGTAAVVLAWAPLGQDTAVAPYIGGGVALGGINSWSPVIAAGANFTRIKPMPFLQFEQFTNGSRPSIGLGIRF